MGPELKIELAVCREAEAAGWLQRKLVFVGTRGAPDRLFGRDGRAVIIEFKKPGEIPTRQQTLRIRELRREFGFEVHWCDSVEKGRRILNLDKDKWESF